MNKGKILLIGLAGMLAVACATDTVDQPQATPEASVANKLVNTSSDAVQGKLLFYVEKGSVAQLEAAASATATGLSALDTAAAELGATKVEQVFNMKVNAELKRELGMDRWFSIEFSKDMDLDAAANILATVDKVQRVEFSTIVKAPNVDEPEVVELAVAGATRAGEFPNDPYFGAQWGLLNEGNRNVAEGKEPTYADYTGEGFVSPYVRVGADINVVPAWELIASKGSTDIIVAVIDNGVDFNHEDLKDNMLVNEKELNGVEGVDDDENGYVDDIYGYNFYTNSPVITFGEGHGTHVAGILGAVSNNGKGIAGVAGGNGNGGVRILSCQMLADEGKAFNEQGYDSAAKALEYAADRGAVIANNSWGNDPGILLNDNSYKVNMSLRHVAFEYFMKKKNHPALDGGILIFAAGNESAAMAGYPGAYNEYVSVTATGPDGLPAYYTNYGPGCNIAAPGGEFFVNQFGHAMRAGCIISTLPDNKYGYMQGTSMATPMVSGVAALMLSYASEIGKCYSLEQFKTMLLTSVYTMDRFMYTKDEDGNDVRLEKKPTISGELTLETYEGKMGTGSIDAYRAMMAIRGISCVPIVAGEECVVDLKSLMADGNILPKTMEDIIIPNDVRERLGITNATIFGDDLIIICENAGSGVIKIVMVAGGDSVGGGNSMGGMRIEKEIALVVSSNYTANNGVVNNPGGWL
ncbi:MAG: S8 family serine peptidase [Alistipes sp.]|nr:S8 family serine peptidase [Alistipes sp.]MBQ8367419.1 S8 family serine peptidase [Alistipes sp.]